MGKFISEFKYALKAPFEYAQDGNMVKAAHLTVKAPNNKVVQSTAILEQAFSDALFTLKRNFSDDIDEARQQKQSKKDVEEEVSPEDAKNSILMMLSQAKDYSKCFIALKEILCFEHSGKANCLIDDMTKMTKPLFDEMAVVDTREVLAEYIQNFLNTSL